MKFLKFFLPVALATGFTVALQAQGDEQQGYATETEAHERDFQALQDFIKTKRAISVKEKGGNLMISGDLRGEWYYMHCKNAGRYERGMKSFNLYPNSLTNKKTPKVSHSEYKHKSFVDKVAYRDGRDKIIAPRATSEFDVEANLMFDYTAERGWGSLRIQMSENAGIPETTRRPMMNDDRRALFGSGSLSEIVLRKCYAGYNVWEQGTSRFDLEIGRRRLYEMFDSRVQFWNFFDGILARYTGSFEGITDLSLKAGVFVIDQNVNHWGYVGELGLLNMVDSGLDFKYSLIDWDKHGQNRFGLRHALGCRFVNSQFLLNYSVSPDLVPLKTQVYAATIINHAAPKSDWTHHLRSNKAYYAGAQFGEAVRKGDYALGFIYEWVGAQAIPEKDISPANRDNPRGISFYSRRSGGWGNFRGWRLQGLYALTDNWTIDAHFDRIREFDRRIGGKHRSYEGYLAAIFAF